MTNKTNKLNDVQRRAVQYWFVDGLAEISIGLTLLLLAVFFVFWYSVFSTGWGPLVAMLALLAVSYAGRRVIQGLKERGTYPRTGYAAPQSGLENKNSFGIAVGFALLLLALNLAVTTRGELSWNWTTLFSGLVLSFVIGWTGYVTKLRRFRILALISLVVGAALAFAGFENLTGSGILSGILGISVLIMGIRTRQEYLRQNPPLEQ